MEIIKVLQHVSVSGEFWKVWFISYLNITGWYYTNSTVLTLSEWALPLYALGCAYFLVSIFPKLITWKKYQN